jgi:hypothetical protein
MPESENQQALSKPRISNFSFIPQLTWMLPILLLILILQGKYHSEYWNWDVALNDDEMMILAESTSFKTDSTHQQ